MLLLKKKKYAALVITEKNGIITTDKETKGLDMVRRYVYPSLHSKAKRASKNSENLNLNETDLCEGAGLKNSENLNLNETDLYVLLCYC